ncbi:WD40/YVTN/BNR-like repeat-containing protein [Lachnospiraceae bacterium LCP25S3_G4]
MKQKSVRILIGVISVLLCAFVVVLSLRIKNSIEQSKSKIVTITEGKQRFVLKKVLLEKNGLKGLINQIENCEGFPEHANISYLRLLITKAGKVEDFTLTLEGFDNQKQYTENLTYVYNSADRELEFSRYTQTELPSYYDENTDIVYLDTQMRRIPLEAEIALLHFESYHVEIQKDIQIPEGQAIMDGRGGKEFPLLSFEDYQRGIGGVSDGASAVVISLNDGVGATGKRIEYYCDAVNEHALAGHPETTMPVDYYINNGTISLTDDAGETWYSTGLSESQVMDTLETYRNGNLLPENSIYANRNGFFALFYGEEPILRISNDNGVTWKDIPFQSEMVRESTRRVVHFLDEQNGYAGIGTDWSMGTGVSTYVYWTHDGGSTWTESSVLSIDGQMLTGIAFADPLNGIATLETMDDTLQWPIVYTTIDAGESFQELSFPWEQLHPNTPFLNKIDSLVFENETYTLVLGQGSYGNRKARFISNSLTEGWTCQEEYIGTVHTEG